MNIFIDHVGDGHKHYRIAITSILYNEWLRRRCVTKKGNVAQVEFYNIDIYMPYYNGFLTRQVLTAVRVGKTQSNMSQPRATHTTRSTANLGIKRK